MEKTALIVTDGAASTYTTAEAIASALVYDKVRVVSAGAFERLELLCPELLAAGMCFFGAETPNPPSFSYLCKMLAHINLAGRRGGLFAASQETAEYLYGMVRTSELALPAGPLVGLGDVKAWVTAITGAST